MNKRYPKFVILVSPNTTTKIGINDQNLATTLVLVVNVILLTTKYKSRRYKLIFNDKLNKLSLIYYFPVVNKSSLNKSSLIYHFPVVID